MAYARKPPTLEEAAGSKLIQQYVKECRIGAGGFGRVYLVKDKSTGKRFALKECYKREIERTKTVHHLMRERRTLSRLNHPFIIALRKAFQDTLSLYMILDYMPNGALWDYLAKYGRFTDTIARFYTAELVLALEYLRSVQVVHRDLKLPNILLDDKFHIKLTDFGTCHVVVERDVIQRGFDHRPIMTHDKRVLRGRNVHPNSRVGTEGYLAPEILTEAPVTYGTDLWALGCLLFEFHTGQYCFKPGRDHYHKINSATYEYPRGFPQNTDIADLVQSLVIVDAYERLGMETMDDIKVHHFFHSEGALDWETLHTQTPPTFVIPPEDEALYANMTIDWDDLDSPEPSGN